jgi:hypothetical protein
MNLLSDSTGYKTKTIELKVMQLFGNDALDRKEEGIKYATDIYS